MKEWITKYQKAIVGTGAVSVLLICYFQQKELVKLRTELKKVDSLNIIVDSLQLETFNANNAAGRYELSLQHIEKTHPKAAKEFDRFLKNETE
jgi:hypothetical protein